MNWRRLLDWWLSGSAPFDPSLVDRAEAENVLSDHARILRRLDQSSEVLKVAQTRLQDRIREARDSTDKVTRRNRDALHQVLLVCAGAGLVLWLAAPAIAADRFTGVASYYGNESGSRTASGERFDERKLTCAHRSLAFGTRLRVTYRGRSVVCRVNDRGPFIAGRVVDLSTAAALAIGLAPAAGVGLVDVQVVPAEGAAVQW